MPPQAPNMSISNLNPFRLAKLYSDSKPPSNTTPDPEFSPPKTLAVDSPEYQEIQRLFRVQKDRLVTWGLEWSDGTTEIEGKDDRASQVDLTENVQGVMGMINQILEEVECMRTGRAVVMKASSDPFKVMPFPAAAATESRDLSADDGRRCEDLCKDLSSCIDVLYELSRSRRAIQEGTYPMANAPTTHPVPAPEKQTLPPPISKALFSNRSFSSSGETLVTPSRVSTGKTLVVADAPPKLDKRDLMLPQEPPPAYGSHGSQAVRMIGHLRRSTATSVPFTYLGQEQHMQPVMVEYAFFDPTYRETGVRLPPTDKLDALINYFARNSVANDTSGYGTLPCAGWFEDLDSSRYGIVYELPRALRRVGENGRPRDLRPATLISILQSASRVGAGSTQVRQSISATPPLEDRFRLAYNIMRAVSRIDDDTGVVHRNICSNNILFFTKAPEAAVDADASSNELYELSEPFVVGFDLFSEYDITSPEDHAQSPNSNIYQHPEAVRRASAYSAEFDAYSLGLVLLEVGLWIPLSDLWKAKYSLADFKSRLEAIWVKKLAAKVGSTYMNVVKDLLAAAGPRRRASFGTAEAKSRLGQVYSRSLGRLRRCCMIDEAELLDTPASDSMQNSALEAMVRQGALVEQEQAISYWSEKTRLANEQVAPVPGPLADVGLSAESPAAHLPDKKRGASATDYRYPNALPVAIEEANEDALSRQPSDANITAPCPPQTRGVGAGEVVQPAETSGGVQPASHATYYAAARTIQRAWRGRRDMPSFQEYKRKITFIQQLWRRRLPAVQSTLSSGAQTGASSFHTSTEYLDGQRSTERDLRGTTAIHPTPRTTPRKKLRIQPKKLPPSQVTQWHTVLLPMLERIVSRALRDSPETCSIDLLCVGETPAKARATIFVTCSSTSIVKAALSRRFEYDRDTFDLKVRRGSIRRSKSHSTKRVREAHRSMAAPTASMRDGSTAVPLNPFHQKRPICGASIGAYTDSQHLPPVSFGGVVAVDSGDGTQLFGMTVHHLLDSPSDDDCGDDDDDTDTGESGFFEDSDGAQTSPGATRSSAAGASSWLAGMGAAPGLGLNDVSLHSGFLEISDDSSLASDAGDQQLDDSSDEEDSASINPSHASTEGDLVGVSPGGGEENVVYVTQPAIDDVAPGFFPDMVDRDEDHLTSHKFGVVYASSGIRRWQRSGISHEVDWALMKLDNDRLQPINVVQGGRKYLQQRRLSSLQTSGAASSTPAPHSPEPPAHNLLVEAVNARRESLHPKLVEPVSRSPHFSAADDEYPTDIVPADELGSLRVHSFGRTSGLQEGVIGDAMSSVRIYRRRSFSRSWHVLGGFGMGGDSGAWIIDNDTGRVCGHVLAFAERNSMAYICPLEIMFEDILRVLKANSIWLPGGEKAAIRGDLRRRGTSLMDTSLRIAQDDEDDLPFALNELDLEDTDTDDVAGGVVLRTPLVRTAGRAPRDARDHDRERLMYAPGGLLSLQRGETLGGAEREPLHVLV